jgi:prepilin-type N-terminal cleavage/methylation domain-containing protein
MPVATPARRSGFTLLEVIVALVLTSVIVLVAYTMMQVGLDARERLTVHLRDVQRTRAAREILREALRNARAPRTPGDPAGGVFLSNGTLSFVAAGGAAPLDPDYDWRLVIAAGRGALNVVATPIGHAPPTQVVFSIPNVSRWDVRLLSSDGRTWQSDWSDPKDMPRAAAIAFWNGNRLSGPPLHIALWPGSALAAPDSVPGVGPTAGVRSPSP